MATLQIEHPVTDFNTWKAAFDRFADVRGSSGVCGHRVMRPIDDARYVVVDLDFRSAQAAREFLAFLQANVWGSAARAPALAGSPQTRILETADMTPGS